MRALGWIGASASLALAIVLFGCGGGRTVGTAGTGCANAQDAHRAYVVVEHLGGRTVQRCVGFNGATISGATLMRESGLSYQTQTFSGLGPAVCALDGQPAHYSTCFPKGQPYWALYVLKDHHWVNASTGFASIKIGNGGALGWEYEPSSGSPPPPPLPKT